jgi:hypothetical protein
MLSAPHKGVLAIEWEEPLLFVLVGGHRFQIVGFYDQTAVETLDVIDAVAPGDNHGTGVLTSGLHGLHKANYGFILAM